MAELALTVSGVHCKSCVMLITDELTDLGALDINIRLDEKANVGNVTLKTYRPRAEIVRAIESLGEYKVQH